jgi:hypothetical protein
MKYYPMALALIVGLPSPAPAHADQPAHPPLSERNVCTGIVSGIETSQDSTPGAWLWLKDQHCKLGTAKDQPTEFTVTHPQSSKVWYAAFKLASAAFARSGTVTLEYQWTEGMSTTEVPRVTRINAPCMSGTAGGC